MVEQVPLNIVKYWFNCGKMPSFLIKQIEGVQDNVHGRVYTETVTRGVL